jgi:Protein of unknown function (DUF3618)
MSGVEPSKPEPGPDASLDEIQADIEATRHALGQTVEAVSAKLDVKQRVGDKVDDAKGLVAEKAHALQAKGSDLGSQAMRAATDDKGSVRPIVPVAAFAVPAVIVGILLWKRRR